MRLLRLSLLALLVTACGGDVTSVVDPDTGLLEVVEWEGGRRHGVSQTYYPDGVTIKEQTRYQRGVREGPHLEWHANGATARELTFRRGLRHGTERAWFESGEPASEGEWIDGDRDGLWIRYGEDGGVVREEDWDLGTRSAVRVLREVAGAED